MPGCRSNAGNHALRVLLVGVVFALLDTVGSFLVPTPAIHSGAHTSSTTCIARSSARINVLQLRAAALTAPFAAKKAAPKPRGYWHDFSNVEAEIRAYITADGTTSDMPSTSQLRKNGLSSLADAITRFGGVQEVAAKLGLSCGKPKGYWQNYSNTRKEFEDFLAIWRKAVGEPQGVPTQEMIRKAGRQDLIAAMQLHGGMQRLAQDLDLTFFTMRRSGAGAVSGVDSGRHKVFQGRLWSFIAVNGTHGYMPSTEVLRNFGCEKLAEDVDRHGGTVRVAKRFNLKPQRRPIGLELIEESLMHFVKTSGQEGVMPSKDALAAAGRLDLDTKLEEIGRQRVCKFLGLYIDEHAKLQAECDTQEALSSASFVKLAVKSERPDLKYEASQRKTFVRQAPLFKGDTSMHASAVRRTARRASTAATRSTTEIPRSSASVTKKAIQASEVMLQQESVKSSMRTAARAIAAAVEGCESKPQSLEEMKQRFRKRLVASGAPSAPASKISELESLFRKVSV